MLNLPETGLLKISQIIGHTMSKKKSTNYPLIPVSKSTWWNGIKDGRFPKPVRLGGGRGVFWRVEDIRALLKTETED